MAVSVTPRGLMIHEELTPVYSGSVHYWRLERELWDPILDNVKAMGFQMICSYIPWAVHEVAPGEFDFGEQDPRKDIDAFLSLCEAKGIWVLVRPGPHINAELTRFGFPEWVLMDPQVQARTATGSLAIFQGGHTSPPKQFPIPSYASERFYQLVGQYFDQLCPILMPHLAPNGGCIVGCQTDNETCYFFRDRTYDLDYSDGAIALYRRMLRDKYGTITALNERYGSDDADFEEVEPPRDFEATDKTELPWYFDWAEYKEYHITWSLVRIARMLQERGIVGAPIFHDVAWQFFPPLDMIDLEAQPEIEWVGMNLYRNKEQYAASVIRMKYLAGSTELPFVPEFGSGVWSHHPRTFDPHDEEFIALSAFMHGLKAVNYYMIVERERWQGSPITRDNRRRSVYFEFYRKLNCFLEDNRFWEFDKIAEVLLLQNYDLERFSALYSTLNVGFDYLLGLPAGLQVPNVDLGWRYDVASQLALHEVELNVLPQSWLGKAAEALRSAQVDFNLSDTHLQLERIQRYKVACLPTVDFMDTALQEKLVAYVRRGGRLVIGPGLPYLGMDMKPASILGRYLSKPGGVRIGRGELVWLEEPTLEGILGDVEVERPFILSDSRLDLAVHHHGERQILFVANPTAEEIKARLDFMGQRWFIDLWSEEGDWVSEDSLDLTLPPYTVRIWEVLG